MQELYSLLRQYPIVFLDLETNGLAVNTDVLEVGALKFAPGELLSREEPVGIPFHRYVYFEGIPDPGAFGVNHLDPFTLKTEGAPIREVVNDLNQFVEEGIVGGQNIKSFDLPILHYQAVRHNTSLDYVHIIDTKIIARNIISLPSYSLAAMSSYFNITHRPTHRALDDVKATVQVFRKLISL